MLENKELSSELLHEIADAISEKLPKDIKFTLLTYEVTDDEYTHIACVSNGKKADTATVILEIVKKYVQEFTRKD